MKYSFGVDVGGTAVKIGLFEGNQLLVKTEIPTKVENGGCAILPDVAATIDRILSEKGIDKSEVCGIGVGVPGPVEADGLVNCCVNLNWGVFNLHETLGALTGLRVVGGNDANCAALGEYYYGGGKGANSAIFVTLGTGVGGGVILDGKLLGGAHSCAGEIGHITVNAPDQKKCTCGKYGCLEQYASATGIVAMAKEHLAQTSEASVLRNIEKITCKDVFDAAKADDAFAVAVLEQVFDYLGEAIASACCVCDPECVILGGGVSKAGDYLLNGANRYFKKHIFHASSDTKFALATLGNDAGMYGANRLVVSELEG